MDVATTPTEVAAERAATRVVDAQRQAARGLRLSLAFLLAAAAAAASGAGDGPWLALHLFLVGGVVSAIAAATQLLAVTWSAAPAPDDRLVATQRWGIALGAVAVAVGRELDRSALAAAGGLAVLAGLALLAWNVAAIRRSGRNDRFHPAIDAYLAATGCAALGVAMGTWLAVAQPGASWVDVRAAHVTLNLFGFVGLVIAGTLPAFVATQARTRMHPRATPRHQRLPVAAIGAGVVTTAAGQLAGIAPLTAAGRGAMLTGWLGTVALLPHLGRRQLAWAGPRLLQLAAGITWWIAVLAALVVSDLDGKAPSTDLLAALAVGGLAQILVASLAYLGPVIRAGGHEHLTAGFATTRSWASLAIGNVAAASLVAGADVLAVSLLALWAAEVAIRAARLHLGGSGRTRTTSPITTIPTEGP